MSATLLPPKASVITVSNGASVRLISSPALEKSLLRASISCLTASVPDAYSSLKLALAPELTPSPHLPAPLPGFEQVLTPPAFTVHPLSFSSLVAALTSNGYGLLFSNGLAKLLAGLIGTGP